MLQTLGSRFTNVTAELFKKIPIITVKLNKPLHLFEHYLTPDRFLRRFTFSTLNFTSFWVVCFYRIQEFIEYIFIGEFIFPLKT